MRKWPLKRGGFFLGVKQFSSILLTISSEIWPESRSDLWWKGLYERGATVLHNSVLHELRWCVSIREGKNAFNFTININWVVCPWPDSFLNYRILCNYNLSSATRNFTPILFDSSLNEWKTYLLCLCYMILKLYIQFWKEKNYKFNIS